MAGHLGPNDRHNTQSFGSDDPVRRPRATDHFDRLIEEQRISWNEKNPKRLEYYTNVFPELIDHPDLLVALIFMEYRCRQQAGESPTTQEYQDKFPQFAERVGRALDPNDPRFATRLDVDAGAYPTRTPRSDESNADPPRVYPRGQQQLETLNAGEKIDDFELLAPLGKGAFGRVFLALQGSLRRLVALKISEHRDDEPMLLAKLDHPHIVRVYDQRIISERGLRLLYMQYVPGGNLETLIAHARSKPKEAWSARTIIESIDAALERAHLDPPPAASRNHLLRLSWPEVVCTIGQQLALALAHAQKQGVLHRDVKPANVLLDTNGSAKLADFNVGLSHATPNPTTSFGGTLAYMSPEHLDACHPERRKKQPPLEANSDLYSLSITLWELLTGRRPHDDGDMKGDWMSIIDDMAKKRRAGVSPERLTDLPANTMPGLAQVLLRCLDPDPKRRYSSGEEMHRALALCFEPRAREYIEACAAGWRGWAAKFPLTWYVVLALSPNIAAGWFNLVYNRDEIIAHHPQAGWAFQTLILIINGIAFPAAIAICFREAWPITRAILQSVEIGTPAAPEIRERSLRLAEITSRVALIGWVCAGVSFGVGLWVLTGRFSAEVLFHFTASQTLCGLVAAVYPYFLVTLLSLRSWYPRLMGSDPTPSDVEQTSRAARQMAPYLLLAAVVPMLAILALVMIGSENRFALLVFSIAGLAGFAGVFAIYRQVLGDVEALARVVRSPE